MRGGRAGTCTQLARELAVLQTGSVSLPSTLPWGESTGLAPASSRVTASRLDYFGIDHQSAWEDLHLQPLAYRASTLLLSYRQKSLDGRTCTRMDTLPKRAPCCSATSRKSLVGVSGIAPPSSRIRTARSPTELHPDLSSRLSTASSVRSCVCQVATF